MEPNPRNVIPARNLVSLAPALVTEVLLQLFRFIKSRLNPQHLQGLSYSKLKLLSLWVAVFSSNLVLALKFHPFLKSQSTVATVDISALRVNRLSIYKG